MYRTNPRTDVSYVSSLKETLRSRYGGQNSLDIVMRDLYIQKHKIEGAAPNSPDIKFRAVGTGVAGGPPQPIARTRGDAERRQQSVVE